MLWISEKESSVLYYVAESNANHDFDSIVWKCQNLILELKHRPS